MLRSVRLRIASGKYAITAIALSITVSAHAASFALEDLNYFQVDCRIKQQQIEFLQSLRPSVAERGNSRLMNFFMPWQYITNHEDYTNRASAGMGRTDWLINQLLMELRTCP